MADAFGELLAVDNSLVRKWGRTLVAVQDYSQPVPTTFFNVTTKVPILPETAKQLGFITTDGVTAGRAISANDTQMMQDVAPVRSDLENLTDTIVAAFGEGSNAFVHAVYNGRQVKDFPDSPKSPFVFGNNIDLAEYPYYRVWQISADGVGDQAFYRVEYAPRAKVTSVTDRNKSRSNPESMGFTFTAYKDKEAGGLPIWVMENGPGFGTVTPPAGG